MKWSFVFILIIFLAACKTSKQAARFTPVRENYTPAQMTQMLDVLMLTTGSNDKKISELEKNVVLLSKEQWEIVDGVVSMKPKQTFDTIIVRGWMYIGQRADSIINARDTIPSFERKQPTQ